MNDIILLLKVIEINLFSMISIKNESKTLQVKIKLIMLRVHIAVDSMLHKLEILRL